ncbi:hypothetical protein ACIXIM_11145 [Bacteroides fragilis]
MESIPTFISIIFIVFGILQIILFFKMWGMTNNVSRITRLLESKELPNNTLNNAENKTDDILSDTYSDIAVGSVVIRQSDGRKMVVDSIENGEYFCKGSTMEGYKYYSRNEISPN